MLYHLKHKNGTYSTLVPTAQPGVYNRLTGNWTYSQLGEAIQKGENQKTSPRVVAVNHR